MNLENTLFWIAVLSCAALLARGVPLLRRGLGWGWMVVGTAILIVGGVGMAWFPLHVGAVVGILWFVLIALPSLLIHAALRNALGQRYPQAERLARGCPVPASRGRLARDAAALPRPGSGPGWPARAGCRAAGGRSPDDPVRRCPVPGRPASPFVGCKVNGRSFSRGTKRRRSRPGAGRVREGRCLQPNPT